jgi:YD repeat-containing protein
MKHTNTILFCLALFILSSCKKDKDQAVNPDDVRLVSIEMKGTNYTSHLDFAYDASGRIMHVSSHDNNSAPVSILDVTYNGNEALLVGTPLNSAGTNHSDSTRLLFDAGRLSQKIKKSFNEYFYPYNDPQRSFTQDTTIYEYNTSGLLTREIKNTWDSTWRNVSNSGLISTSIYRTNGSNSYSLSNGNVVSMTGVTNWTFITRQGTQTVLSSRSSESTANYEYAKSSVNKTDFSNAAIINEVAWFTGLPLNEKYHNLPNKLTSTYTERAQSGAVVSSTSNTTDYQYAYNGYGFLSSLFDPATPDLKTIFVYNK